MTEHNGDEAKRCVICGHPQDWHRCDDTKNYDLLDPATPFRCIGYDCEMPGPPIKNGCDCPDFEEKL